MEAEQFLRDFHDRWPGVTSAVFSAARCVDQNPSSNISSYDRLRDEVWSAGRLLDLACGDGHLLGLLAAPARLPAVGVDLSMGELLAARRRLGPRRALLVQALAQSLPFRAGTFDAVSCHLAFMLMADIEQVLSEVRRVLRAGGLFGGAACGGSAGRHLRHICRSGYSSAPARAGVTTAGRPAGTRGRRSD